MRVDSADDPDNAEKAQNFREPFLSFIPKQGHKLNTSKQKVSGNPQSLSGSPNSKTLSELTIGSLLASTQDSANRKQGMHDNYSNHEEKYRNTEKQTNEDYPINSSIRDEGTKLNSMVNSRDDTGLTVRANSNEEIINQELDGDIVS